MRLLRDLCPEAAERLYGNDAETSVECYSREHPAPGNIRLKRQAEASETDTVTLLRSRTSA